MLILEAIHRLSNRKIKEFGENLNKMIRFMEVHDNPFCVNKDDTKLKNFVTQIYAIESVAERFYQFPVEITNEFQNYQQNVYIHQTSLESDRIKKVNLLPINHEDTQKSTVTKDVRISEKESRKALKTLMIAKGKFGDVTSVLKYEITSYSYLFDGDKMTSGCKSKLIEEIEKMLLPSDYDFKRDEEYDFMSFIRNQKVDRTEFKTFGGCIEDLFNRLIYVYNKSTVLHVIFDSYVAESWKGSTRQQRVKGLIHLASISGETLIPVQMKKVWGSQRNKEMMQSFFCVKFSIAKQPPIHSMSYGTLFSENQIQFLSFRQLPFLLPRDIYHGGGFYTNSAVTFYRDKMLWH